MISPEFVTRHRNLLVAAISVASIAMLISGGEVLSLSLPGGIPLGNLISVIPFFLPAFLATVLSRPRTRVRRFSIASLIASVAWLPVSFSLAGNANLNFGGMRGDIWIWLSIATAALAAAALTWSAFDNLLRWYRNRSLPGSA